MLWLWLLLGAGLAGLALVVWSASRVTSTPAVKFRGGFGPETDITPEKKER